MVRGFSFFSSATFVTIISGLFACQEPEPAPEVRADFTAEVQGEAPNAQLILTNNSIGADRFLWNFQGLGQTSTEENPSPIMVDRAGIITIVLEAGNGIQASRRQTIVEVEGEAPALTYENLVFRIDDNASLPRFYSAETNRFFLDDEVSAENGPLVDLVLVYNTASDFYFASPDDADLAFDINEASNTVLDLNPANNNFTITDFDTITGAQALDTLTIENEVGLYAETELPALAFFRTGNGYKGIIKIESINTAAGTLTATVKIQKYL